MMKKTSVCRLVQISDDLESDGSYTAAAAVSCAALELAMLREEVADLRAMLQATLPAATVQETAE